MDRILANEAIGAFPRYLTSGMEGTTRTEAEAAAFRPPVEYLRERSDVGKMRHGRPRT